MYYLASKIVWNSGNQNKNYREKMFNFLDKKI